MSVTKCFSPMIHFMADTNLHFQIQTVSYTLSLSLSLSLSLRCLGLFPLLIVWYKNPGIHFQVINDRNKLFEYTSLFHLEVAHNVLFNFIQFFCDQYRKCLNSTLGQVNLTLALLLIMYGLHGFIILSVIILSIIMLEIITQSVNILRVVTYFIGLFEALKSTGWESFWKPFKEMFKEHCPVLPKLSLSR